VVCVASGKAMESRILEPKEPRPVGRPVNADRRREIFLAGKDVLVERGYGGFTMDEVALRARCSKPTLYRHWTDKANFIMAIVDEDGERERAFVSGGSLRGDLLAIVDQVAARMIDRGRLFLGIVIEMQTDRELAGIWNRQSLAGGKTILDAVIDGAIARGELDRTVRREIIYSMIPGTLIWYFMVEKHKTFEDFRVDFVDNILMRHLRATEPV